MEDIIMQKASIKEFNRLYNNLVELHRRVVDVWRKYPIRLCAEWFVDHLTTMLEESSYRQKLEVEEIDNIVEMSINILRTKLLDNDNKALLISNIKQLRQLKQSKLSNIDICTK
jgi:hypothetical protein